MGEEGVWMWSGCEEEGDIGAGGGELGSFCWERVCCMEFMCT